MRGLPPLLSVEMAAGLLRLPTDEVRAAIAAGELPAALHGGTWWVPSRELMLELGVGAGHPDLPPPAPIPDRAG